MESDNHWVGTWATAPAPSLTGESLSDLTLRMNARVSIGGDTLRVRVSNAYGEGKLENGAASLGLRDSGPAIVAGSERPLTFGGSVSIRPAAEGVVGRDIGVSQRVAERDHAPGFRRRQDIDAVRSPGGWSRAQRGVPLA